LLNLDPQLGRRFTPISFGQLDEIDDGKNVRSLLEQYCSAISIEPDPELRSEDFIARLIHSAANEFGILIELVMGAMEICLKRDETTLSKQHFIAEFLRRTGCTNDLNPFVRTNYSAINPRLLLPNIKDMPAIDTTPRKSRLKR